MKLVDEGEFDWQSEGKKERKSCNLSLNDGMIIIRFSVSNDFEGGCAVLFESVIHQEGLGLDNGH